MEIDLGFAALHQLLMPFLGRVAGLPSPQRDALGVAFGLQTGPPPDRFLVGMAVLSLLASVAQDQPLLCVIDDAQWLDVESAHVVAFVSRRLYADAVGLLFAGRDSVPLGSVFDQLPTMWLGGLPDDDARQLLKIGILFPRPPREPPCSTTDGRPSKREAPTRPGSTGARDAVAAL